MRFLRNLASNISANYAETLSNAENCEKLWSAGICFNRIRKDTAPMHALHGRRHNKQFEKSKCRILLPFDLRNSDAKITFPQPIQATAVNDLWSDCRSRRMSIRWTAAETWQFRLLYLIYPEGKSTSVQPWTANATCGLQLGHHREMDMIDTRSEVRLFLAVLDSQAVQYP